MNAQDQRAAIEERVPHRDPFLFVDELIDEGPDWIAVRWTVPLDAPWFAGHYPGRPITPGVLLTEHCLQGGAMLAGRLLGTEGEGEQLVPLVTRIQDARFRRIVLPGETLETRIELLERVGPALRLSARTLCDGARTLLVSFVVTTAKMDPDADR